jgi:hypothetical protein
MQKTSNLYIVGPKAFRPDIQKKIADKEPDYFLKGIELLIHRCEHCVEIKGACTEK